MSIAFKAEGHSGSYVKTTVVSTNMKNSAMGIIDGLILIGTLALVLGGGLVYLLSHA